MIANLAGTRPGHALFISDERAVVVDLRDLTSSGPFPEYEVIPAQWDRSPNPAVVPTKAFTLAETVLGDVTVITASGSRAGKRTYAVPRNVRESAKRALTASGGNDIDRDIAQRLSSGKPVQYDTVHHIHLYFSTRDEYGRDSEMFWGGPGGQQWAEKIAAKEMSLVAAASGLHDVQMTPTGAMNPIKNLPPTEDDPDASITDPLEIVDPKEPHVFVPMSFDNPYDCTYCFAPEGAIIHMCDFRQQLINNFGDPSPELAAYDAELAAEDALSENNAGPVTMSGELSTATNPEHSMVASAFFAQPHADDPSCEYHAEYADPDHIAAVYSSHEDGTWNRWNPQAREWEDAGDASEAGLEPLDDNSAYVAAMHQAMDGVENVPVRDLHTVEWAMADEAGDEVVDEVDAFDSIVPEFFVEAAEDDETRVTGLYAQRGETWVVWDPTPGIWVPCPQPSGSLSEVEEDDAEELANWLSSAAGRTEAPDTSTEFSLIASVPRVGRRARPANAPGVVPSMGNPGPVSGRSPYASNTLRGGRGNSWATPARTPSGGMSGDYAKRVKLAPATTGDQGYTPQERSANAKQQVRDGFGRFARGGSRVAYAGGNGTIKKVNPATKQVQIESDPDAKGKTTTSWVDAKSTRVMPPNHGDETPPQRGENRRAEPPGGSRVDGQPDAGGDLLLPADGPRATRYTAKARLKTMQAPLTRAALTKMLKNAPAYFRAERARARRINRNWNSSDGITASANHDGVMVAFFLDPETAQQFAVPGGESPEHLHMTLAYLGDQNEAGIDADGLARVVGEWAAKTPPITGEISGHGVFTNGDKPVTHMSVDCPDLPAARQSLIEHLQAAGLSPRMDHGFDPHITLAYADTPVDVPATPVTFNKVTVSHGPNDMDMPMGGAMMAAATPTAVMTPDNSDVTPMYLAIVDKLDKAAVLDLLALVPASATSEEPVLFKRTVKGWERDDNMLSSLRSATPPPVVTLDAATYKDVVAQVDQTLTAEQAPDATAASGVMDLYNEYGELLPALAAAGGLDKNRGSAERLRRYWTIGPGGAKIRWGQGGDWYRCVRHLSKYLGPRAKGYCQLRHQEMVRMSTAQHAKLLRGKGGVRGGGFEYPDEQISVELAAAWERAESAPMVASAAEGARFYIPIIVPEGVPTGDGRIFKPLAVTHRNLPIPLMWQMKTAEGHDGSVVVGRIDSIERVANGLGNAYGVLDTSPHALEVERLIRNGFLRGVSADLDNFEAETTKNEDETLGKDDKSEKISADTTTISKARVMGVTAVPKPAFQECEIHLIEEEPEQQEDPVIPDGVYAERDDETLVACALVASQIPVVPPADWFADPGLNEPTPLTVTDDGRVYGHIAAWHVDHIGMPFGTKPPRSRSGYKYFHTGVVRTDNGKDVPVGQLTLAGGHASLELSADAAVKHYDDTHSAVADVHAGEDAHGIWVAGALRPDVDASRIRSLRASAPSGDWRPIGGRLELVAVCQVNVPGFPVARARVASGYVTALVAAGAAPLAQLKGLSVEDRIKRLEDEALSAKMDALRERMAPAFAARSEELALRASAARERMEALRSSASDLADYSPDTREAYARKGWAMPDGSFPIANAGDLKNAVRAYGRAASGDRAKVRRHIMKRARGLGRADIIPTSWTSASIEERWQDVRAQFAELSQRPVTASAELTAQRDAAIARMNALLAAGPEFDPNKHPRSDETGQFREVLFRLNDTIKDAPNSESTSKEIDHVIELMDDGDLQKVKIATDNLLESVDQIAQQVDVSLPDLAHTIREGYSALGEAIARLPLAQGNDQERLRWSDLPPELQSLVDDVMTKLKTHVSDEAFRDITGQVSTYKSGIDTATSDEIQSWLARMVKYLLD